MRDCETCRWCVRDPDDWRCVQPLVMLRRDRTAGVELDTVGALCPRMERPRWEPRPPETPW